MRTTSTQVRPEIAEAETRRVGIKTLIDNRPDNAMLKAVRRLMAESHKVDIATGYFEIGAMVDLDGHWQTLKQMRLLMGDEVRRATKQVLVDALKSRANGIERAKEADDWRALEGLESVKGALIAGDIQAKVYTRAKFHAKAYHFYTKSGVVNHGIVGSSNFTYSGLTQNLELNLFTSDSSQLEKLAEWYQRAWDEAEDIKDDLLQIIQPHIVPYSPFQIYLQAMRERFSSLEPEVEGWEQSESKIYNLLATYQKDAYHELMHKAKTWGGGLLCDGVGLGKTYVALMLVERALKEKHKVLIIAPKATIPSVWNKNLSRFFPDDFDPDPNYQHDIKVIPHTDLGRQGGITQERLEKLRARYETIIVDEAHHFRVQNRNRSKKLKALTKDRNTFLMTATPVNNSVLDLYNLINYIAQDRQKHFQSVNVPNLRAWFTKMLGETDLQQLELQFTGTPEFQEFLKHIIVQRSRKYVKSLEKQDDQSVKFPTREKPHVIKYSLSNTYGKLLPQLIQAFDSRKAKLKLAIYETEKFKEKNAQDSQTLQEQSQVVGLIRTMLLKRLESSQKALEASIEDLLLKHLTLLKDLPQTQLRYETWLAEHRDVFDVLQRHRQERMGLGQDDDEEEDDLPITNYENKKIEQVKSDITLFGRNEPEWIKSLEIDTETLTHLLRGLHEVTNPENDDKLNALLKTIHETQRLRKDKLVVFSEFKDTARYLEIQLKKAYPKDAIIEVDSGRNVKNREDIIKRFAPHYNCETPAECEKALKDPIRVLISTDVLSEGLNLQDANIIVNYDLHWNPVRLMQRIGRVDRRMDPSKPIQYEKVHVYNFLPPDELEQVLGLYRAITGKLIAINRTLGIEAPVLTANDDFKAQEFYQNLGEAQMSTTERLRLKAHKLEQDHKEMWEETLRYPNRIYSGKNLPPHVGEVPEGGWGRTRKDSNGRAPGHSPQPTAHSPHPYIFFAYRIPTSTDHTTEQPTYDVRWFMLNRATGELIEDLGCIHEAIESTPSTPRVIKTDPEERNALRTKIEKEEIAKILFRSQIPSNHKAELICWMEV